MAAILSNEHKKDPSVSSIEEREGYTNSAMWDEKQASVGTC
jgi:hypothetical protein